MEYSLFSLIKNMWFDVWFRVVKAKGILWVITNKPVRLLAWEGGLERILDFPRLPCLGCSGIRDVRRRGGLTSLLPSSSLPE